MQQSHELDMQLLKKVYYNNNINEFGLFGGIFLLILPINWIIRLTQLCYGCCCASNDYLATDFFVFNKLSLKIVVIYFLITYPLELFFLLKTNERTNTLEEINFLIGLIFRPIALFLLFIGDLALESYMWGYIFFGVVLSNIVFWQRKVLNIYFFLMYIILPPLNVQAYACNCTKISSVKANMHTLQADIENYRRIYGFYPDSLKKFEKPSGGKLEYKKFYNPFLESPKIGVARIDYHDFLKTYYPTIQYEAENNGNVKLKEIEQIKPFYDIAGVRIFTEKPQKSMDGLVIYNSLSKDEYQIIGTGRVLERVFVRDKGNYFILSNQDFE